MKAYVSKEEKEKDEEAEGGKALEKGRRGGLEGALKGRAGPLLPRGPHAGCPHLRDQGAHCSRPSCLPSTSRPRGLRGLQGPKCLLATAQGQGLSQSLRDPPAPVSPQEPPAWAQRALLSRRAGDTRVAVPN